MVLVMRHRRKDVQSQQARHDYTEKIIKTAQNALRNASEMSFYIGGIGKVTLVAPVERNIECPSSGNMNWDSLPASYKGDCTKKIP